MTAPTAALEPRTSFLSWHLPRELTRTDEILAVTELRRRLRESFPTRADDIDRWVTADSFFYGLGELPDYRCYLPVPVFAVEKREQPWPELSALLAEPMTAGTPAGVLLTARSGAGKTLACIKALHDCFSKREAGPHHHPLTGRLPCMLRELGPTLETLRNRSDPADVVREMIFRAGERWQGGPRAQWQNWQGRLTDWLRYGPPMLLFVDLNRANTDDRDRLAEGLVAFQQAHPQHRCVVTYRSAAGDGTITRLRSCGDVFRAVDMQPLRAAEAGGYLGNLRRFERRVIAEGLQGDAGAGLSDAAIDGECQRLGEFIGRHVRGEDSLISTPLLMHLVSTLAGTELAEVRTLADLYERVVDGYLRRDLETYCHRWPAAWRMGKGLAGRERLQTAMARVALAILARGEGSTRLTPTGRLPFERLWDNLLTRPDLGRAEWWPADSAWHGGPYYQVRFERAELAAIREAGLWHDDGESIGFVHDSFLYYFAGAVAVRCPENPTIADPVNVTDDGWCGRAGAWLAATPERWRLAGQFLGGTLEAKTLAVLVREVVAQEARPGVTALVQGLLSDRREPEAVVPRVLERCVRRQASVLHEVPAALGAHCYAQMYFREGEEGVVYREWAAGLAKGLAGRMWLRAEAGVDVQDVMILTGHTKGVMALAVLGDGRLVSGSRDNTVRIWDVQTGQCQLTLTGHTNSVSALAVFSDDRLASGSSDRTIRIWDARSGQCQLILAGHTDGVKALAVLTDRWLASGSGDRTIRIWDAQTGQCQLTLTGHIGIVYALAVLNDGQLISSSSDGTIQTWDVRTGQGLITLFKHSGGTVVALAVLGDGQLVSGSVDTTIRIWDTRTEECQLTLVGHTDGVRALAVFGDDWLASGSGDRTIRIWDVRSGQCQLTLTGHTNIVMALVALNDGRLASGNWDDTIRIWDVQTGQCHTTLAGHTDSVRALAVLGDGRLASGSGDHTIRIWDARAEHCQLTLTGHADIINALAVLADGRLASGSFDRTIRIWDISTGQCRHTFSGHTNWINTLAVFADDRLASGSGSNIRIWDVRTGQCQGIEKDSGGVFALMGLGGGQFASGSGDSIHIWDMQSGHYQRAFTGHTGTVRALAALRDGRLASGGADHTIRVWDAQTGLCQFTLTEHTDIIMSLAVLDDGRLASGSWDHTIRVWDTHTGRCLTAFTAGAAVASLVAPPGQPCLVAGLNDGRLLRLSLENV